MAPGLSTALDRRRLTRIGPEATPWHAAALLRPGQEVLIINISHGGALLESHARMVPGARTELQLLGPKRLILRGRVVRCQVTALEPVRYRGAIAFDEWLDIPAAR